MEEQYTEGCSEESCAGCSHSGSCESQKQNAGNTAPSKAPANVGSQVKKSDWSHQRKGWRWKIAGNSFPGTYDDRKRIYGRNFGCRYYRSIHSEDVRSARDGIGNEMGMLPCSAPDGQGSCPSTCFWKRRTHRSSGEVL